MQNTHLYCLFWQHCTITSQKECSEFETPAQLWLCMEFGCSPWADAGFIQVPPAGCSKLAVGVVVRLCPVSSSVHIYSDYFTNKNQESVLVPCADLIKHPIQFLGIPFALSCYYHHIFSFCFHCAKCFTQVCITLINSNSLSTDFCIVWTLVSSEAALMYVGIHAIITFCFCMQPAKYQSFLMVHC